MPINEERGYVMRHNLFLIFTVCNIFYAEAKRKESGTNHTELLTDNLIYSLKKTLKAISLKFSSIYLLNISQPLLLVKGIMKK